METALEWQLKLIRWDFFATLTWDDVESTTARSRMDQVNRWLQFCASRLTLKREALSYVVRWERGELGDRPHCHLLISRIPWRHINLNTCFTWRHYWMHRKECTCEKPQEQHCNRGLAQVRLYEPGGSSLEAYITKGKFGSNWAQRANAYELSKFNSRDLDALWISPRAMQEMVEARTVARRMSPVC